jgi:hypothetical protein
MSEVLHKIPRDEWERLFRAEFVRQLQDDPGDECIKAELESWPISEDDWLSEPPEQAADSNLSYWTDDGEAQ